MRAVGLTAYLPIDNPYALIDVELETPQPHGRDILVEVKAVSVNPVDTKLRQSKHIVEETPRILGFDASGIVHAVGSEVTLFKPDDEVFYAGVITRPGSNSAYQLVDERIVGFKPKSLSHAEAASMPLTSITAYECFFERLKIDRDGADAGQSLLIIGGAGGVGSMGIQLAKLAGLIVLATASRPETTRWVADLGADHVINHRGDMIDEVRGLGFEFVDHIAIFHDNSHWPVAVELIRPQQGIVTIDNFNVPFEMEHFKPKSAALHWEYMFTRAQFETDDMVEQHHLLNYVADQVDAGRLRPTQSEVLSPFNAETMRKAHAMVESGGMIGKVVVEGFSVG